MNNFFKKDISLILTAFLACVFLLSSIIANYVGSIEFNLFMICQFCYIGGFIILGTVGYFSQRKELFKGSVVGLLSVYSFNAVTTFFDTYHSMQNVEFNTILFIGLILALLTIVLSVFILVGHFAINSTNSSNTKALNQNRALILFAILVEIVSFIFGCVVLIKGEPITYSGISSRFAYIFVLLFVGCIETKVNNFRLGREHGQDVDSLAK